jgi:hypothetical protein
MPGGLWRGTIQRVDDGGFLYISLANYATDAVFGPIEPIPGISFSSGERVLCGFLYGGASQLEIIRKVAGRPPGTYTATYGSTY